MNACHCILVKFGNILHEGITDEEIMDYAYYSTEDFFDRAFDSRAAADPPVVRAGDNPELFFSLLHDYSSMPLMAAIEAFEQATHNNIGWYAEDDFKNSESLERLEGMGMVGQIIDGRPLNYGGYRIPFVLDKEFIRNVWEGKASGFSDYHIWSLKRLFEILSGEYVFEARFYSVPDGSTRISKETVDDAWSHPEKYALVFFDCHF